jgi:hypothetical protein
MAVELAKLSLWLHSFTVGAPLSFLDHHLRCGNSLIGTDVRTVEEAIREEDSGQMGLFQGPFAGLLDLTALMVEVVDRADATLSDVQRSAEDFAAFRRALTPYKQVLDLWVSQHFGNAKAEEFLRLFGEAVLPALRGEREVPPEYQATIARAREIWAEKRFFHWDLEFPEVFVDLQGRDWAEEPGFDAVIGNPPYVDIKGLDKELTKYLVEIYPTVHRRINVFAAFLERALNVTKSETGKTGVIIPTAFLTLVSYASLRKLILERYWMRNIVRLPNELFGRAAGDVKVDTCIVIIQKGSLPIHNSKTDILIYDSFERIDNISVDTAHNAFLTSQQRWISNEASVITLMSGEETDVISKIRDQGTSLSDYCEFCLGLTPYDKYTGHTQEQIRNKVFHANSKIDSTYKKLLQSGDVGRYTVQWNGEDWISYGDWLAAPREQRFFTEERILVQQIIDWSSLRIFAGWTNEEIYNTQNQFNLLSLGNTDLKFILAILNSKLISYYHRRAFLDVSIQRFQKILIKDAKELPIPRITLTTPAEERAALLEQAIALYETVTDDTSRMTHDDLLTFVAACLNNDPEQADVVHDLLAHLAKEMMALHQERQQLEKALDPFKFLARGAPFVTFTAAFADALKYGERLPPPSDTLDIDVAHHDIDGLRLAPDGDQWQLDAQCKLRDPADEWRAWQYEEDGRSIARVWVPVYRLPLNEAEGRYYQAAFRVLDEFAHATSFPGGRTRSTYKKLQLTRVPAFDADVDLAPLMDLRAELAEVRARIAATDALIDQIVYRLYGLTEEEIAVVEEG